MVTPAEVIRRLLPSAKWGNPEWQEVKDVLAEEGLVVVSAEDLTLTLAIAAVAVEMSTQDPGARAMFAHLRAALPERTTDGL